MRSKADFIISFIRPLRSSSVFACVAISRRELLGLVCQNRIHA